MVAAGWWSGRNDLENCALHQTVKIPPPTKKNLIQAITRSGRMDVECPGTK